MSKHHLSIAITGAGGAGVISCGELLLQAWAREGGRGLLRKAYGPQIRGGESAALLKLTEDANPTLRIEGIEGLRKRKREEPSVVVIDRFLVLAKTDKDEGVWRCAALGLREVAPSSLRTGTNIPAGAPEAERQSTLVSWERRWRRERKRILAAQKPREE